MHAIFADRGEVMTVRKIIWQVTFVLLGVVLIISLVMNYMNYKRTKREEQYVRLLYNQFIFDVLLTSNELGAVNGHVNYKRAAVNTADAANVLHALENYEITVDRDDVETTSTPHIRDIANFLSYVSLAFVNENEQYLINSGTANQSVVTITQKSVRRSPMRYVAALFEDKINR